MTQSTPLRTALWSVVSRRDVAQPGRALAWGARGRQFKSARPDQFCSSRSVFHFVFRGTARDLHCRMHRDETAIHGNGAMQFRIGRVIASASLLLACVFSGPGSAGADLHWQDPRKENLQVRLIALAESEPRSTFFSTHEVFIAAQQLGKEESRLIKLVYAFLPYQPRLSESDFNYFAVHEIQALRDPSCDQSLAQISSDQRTRSHVRLKYSADSPVLNSSRHHSAMPCYSTTPEDYTKAIYRPPPPEAEY